MSYSASIASITPSRITPSRGMSTSSDRTRAAEDVPEKVHIGASGITLTPELFQQLYAPKAPSRPKHVFGNPTPIAIGGLMLCTTPLSMVLMEWQGAGGFGGAANVTLYIYVGGLLLLLGAIGEWIIGNTFPAILFAVHGGYWINFGATIIPGFGAYGHYSQTGDAVDGLAEPQFFSTFAFQVMGMAIISTFFAIASIRTTVVLCVSLTLLIPVFSIISASFFALGQGRFEDAVKLQHAGGGVLLTASLVGWYQFFSSLLESVDFPIRLPTFDLSHVIPGRSTIIARRNGMA